MSTNFPTVVFRGVNARRMDLPDFSDDEEEAARLDGMDCEVRAFNGAQAPPELLASGQADVTGKTAPNYSDWLREKEARQAARARDAGQLSPVLNILWQATYGEGED